MDAPERPSGPTILLVEDDPRLQRRLADALGREGYLVTVESDGNWAVRTAAQRQFDVLVLDLLLPGIDGYEVARQLKEGGTKTAPVVFMSGVYGPTDPPETLRERYGAIAFLSKPFDQRELFTLLREALGDRAPSPPIDTPAAMLGPEQLTDPSTEQEVAHVEAATRHLSRLHALRGDFAQKPFPEVLAEMHRWRVTGALLVQRGHVKKIIYLRDGVALSVKSNLPSECLGRVLVRERLITEQECTESIHRMKATGRRQGSVLVGMGCLSPQNLAYGLSLQLRTKLYDVFAWEAGEFMFVPRIQAPAEPVQLGLSTASLIYEGVRRTFSRVRLDRYLGDVEGRFPRRSPHLLAALQELSLGEEEQVLLRSLDGRRCVRELRGSTSLSPLDLDRFLYAMAGTQAVELLASPEPVERPATISVEILEVHPADPPNPGVEESGALPSLVMPAPPTADDEVRPHLVARAQAARTQDYFRLLGVTRGVGQEELEEAFFALASRYHPDRFAHLSSMELKALAAEIYEHGALAYETLSHPVERVRYESALDAGESTPRPAGVERLLHAEEQFREGQARMDQKDYAQAHALFHQAVELYPLEGTFYALLGWSRYLLDPARTEEAVSLLERAAELSPTFDRAYLFLGHIYRAQGLLDRAEEHYEKALTCNPGCTEALAELQLLGIRAF